MADVATILQDKSFQARFWGKVERRSENECWPWTGKTDRQGRGSHWVAGTGRHYFAPRIALMLIDGVERPPEQFACHTCDNPGCVNPAHLWWGNRSENMKDCGGKGRHGFQTKRCGANNPQSKLTDDDVRDIRSRYAAGEQPKLIAERYGILSGSVWRIATRKAWKHVQG